MFLECGLGAVETMLACGFDVATTGNLGETKLDWAAFTGSAAMTRILLAHGAAVTARDKHWKSTPIGWCYYSSLNQRPAGSDFPGVARALLDAGATIDAGQEEEAADDVLETVAGFRRSRGASP